MLNKSVARRYAEALFAIAQDNNKVDELQGELELVVQAINAHEELKAYMLHPLIPPKDKKDVIVKLFWRQDIRSYKELLVPSER